MEVLNIIAKSVVFIECSNQSNPTQKPSSKEYCEPAWNAVAYAESNAFLTLLDRQSLDGSKRMWRQLPEIKDLLLPAESGDVLELDEIWSFVFKKTHTRWLWTAMCRRTRQIVAFVIGDRSKATCLRLWGEIPAEYKHCHSFSDFWGAYQQVFPAETHRSVRKETGETAHVERWNNTLRQRVGRYVRQTLSFSKSDEYHSLLTRWFILQYNSGLSLTT